MFFQRIPKNEFFPSRIGRTLKNSTTTTTSMDMTMDTDTDMDTGMVTDMVMGMVTVRIRSTRCGLAYAHGLILDWVESGVLTDQFVWLDLHRMALRHRGNQQTRERARL